MTCPKCGNTTHEIHDVFKGFIQYCPTCYSCYKGVNYVPPPMPSDDGMAYDDRQVARQIAYDNFYKNR